VIFAQTLLIRIINLLLLEHCIDHSKILVYMVDRDCSYRLYSIFGHSLDATIILKVLCSVGIVWLYDTLVCMVDLVAKMFY
jgi:hypothetical protein